MIASFFLPQIYFPILFLVGVSQLNAEISPAQLDSLNELLELNRLEEVITTGENLKNNNQENLELREILFQAYLFYGLPVKAEQEINFIESRKQNMQTFYLRALQAYHTNNPSKALELLGQIKDKRYPAPYLLYYHIRMGEGKFSEAEKYIQQYRGLEGENQNWFFYYGQYLLKRYSPEVSREIAREHIQRYARTYPINHRQMYLRAEYYAHQSQFDLALNYIDKAIYLNSSFPDYLDKKIYYLYRDHQFNSLNKIIDDNRFSTQKRFIHYKWVKSFVNFLRLKKEDLFTLSSPQHLNWVISPIEEILTINPENEVIRFFAEEIILANTLFNDKRRLPYANYHYQRSIYFQEKGQWQGAQYAFSRMLLLSPQNPNYLEAYLEYLRRTQQYELYQIEANNYLTEFSQTNREHRYIPIRKQLADKAVSETLAGRHGLITLIPPRLIRLRLSYTPRSFKDSWEQPYIEHLTANMLSQTLQIPPLLQVDIIRQNPSQTTDPVKLKDAENYDYHSEFSLNDENQILTINFKVWDRQKVMVYNRAHSFYGKERYQKMITTFQDLVYQIFPKTGTVTLIDERQAIISLGSRHGAQPEDIAIIYKNNIPLGSFPIEIVDNYYSLITIDKIFVLSKTEIGDRVILQVNGENSTQ